METRPILFRGKRVDTGEWVEGLPSTDVHYRWFITVDYSPQGVRVLKRLEIDPATVGQFTGLTDKHGENIFEGDIIQLDTTTCPITWDDGGFQMVTVINQGRSPVLQDRTRKFEIIGNIHDTPELLK